MNRPCFNNLVFIQEVFHYGSISAATGMWADGQRAQFLSHNNAQASREDLGVKIAVFVNANFLHPVCRASGEPWKCARKLAALRSTGSPASRSCRPPARVQEARHCP